jgi:hypothetical protein
VLVFVVSAVAALLVWGGPRQPRFIVTATPRRAPRLAECRTLPSMRIYGPHACRGASQIPWFHLVVRNVGDGGGFVVGCYVEGRDAEGRPLPKLKLVSVQMPDRHGPDGSTTDLGGVYIPAGGTFTYDYFLLDAAADPSQVPHRYSAWCRLHLPQDLF